MDTFKNKRYFDFNYTCRYTGVPYYYDTVKGEDVFGIGKQMRKDTAWVAHKVRPDDSLDSLALKYYNDPTYWWIIAYFNDIIDPFKTLKDKFDVIKIPSISSIEFKDPR